MDIHAFTPIVFTKDASGLIRQMESLGFEARHTKDMGDTHGVVSTILKDAQGHSMATVESAGFPQTFTGIRVMVGDFAAAVAEFEAMGYVNVQAKGSADTGSSVATLMRSPEGLFVSVAQHFR